MDYLARYNHRIATGNGRLWSMEGDRISFRYKDYRNQGRLKTQWLEGPEFVRRFLMHILPKGFMRIRHFGYPSNRTRRRKLPVIRCCLLQPSQPETNQVSQEPLRCWPCLRCNDGLVHMARQIPRFRIVVVPTGLTAAVRDLVGDRLQFLVSWACVRPKTGKSGICGVI